MKQESHEWEVSTRRSLLSRDLRHTSESLLLCCFRHCEWFAKKSERICPEHGVGDERQLMRELQSDQCFLEVVGSKGSKGEGDLRAVGHG